MPSLPCGISNWSVGQTYRKYGIRQTRLDLIQRWCTRCSRHYKLTKPHKNKRMKRVMILCNNQLVETTYFELKSMPVKPGSLYHDEPADIPRGKATALFVERRRDYNAGDACLNWRMSFRFVPHPWEIVFKRCMRCGTRYESLNLNQSRFLFQSWK